jgi:hypothetical protein
MNYLFKKHIILVDLHRFGIVLFGFTPHLASHICRSFSNHSYGYGVSNDQQICFASYTVKSESLVHYAGEQ